jgi:D-glycero-alpha-D-manno-heptose-7-phosphate kinase
MSNEYKKYLESHIMLGFSGVSRLAEVHAKKNVDNIKEGKIDNLLLEMASSTNEAILMLTKEKEMGVIGELLDTAWSIKRNLADGVTQKWIDNIYFSAIENGAYGGKLMGAGGGGFFMFLVPPTLQEHFKKTMKEIKVWVPFQFDNNGSQIILNNM